MAKKETYEELLDRIDGMTFGDLLEYLDIPSDEAHNYDRLDLLEQARDEAEDLHHG
jgi:hypothetical protein